MSDLNLTKTAPLLDNLAQKLQPGQLQLPLWVDVGLFYLHGLYQGLP